MDDKTLSKLEKVIEEYRDTFNTKQDDIVLQNMTYGILIGSLIQLFAANVSTVSVRNAIYATLGAIPFDLFTAYGLNEEKQDKNNSQNSSELEKVIREYKGRSANINSRFEYSLEPYIGMIYGSVSASMIMFGINYMFYKIFNNIPAYLLTGEAIGILFGAYAFQRFIEKLGKVTKEYKNEWASILPKLKNLSPKKISAISILTLLLLGTGAGNYITDRAKTREYRAKKVEAKVILEDGLKANDRFLIEYAVKMSNNKSDFYCTAGDYTLEKSNSKAVTYTEIKSSVFQWYKSALRADRNNFYARYSVAFCKLCMAYKPTESGFLGFWTEGIWNNNNKEKLKIEFKKLHDIAPSERWRDNIDRILGNLNDSKFNKDYFPKMDSRGLYTYAINIARYRYPLFGIEAVQRD